MGMDLNEILKEVSAQISPAAARLGINNFTAFPATSGGINRRSWSDVPEPTIRAIAGGNTTETYAPAPDTPTLAQEGGVQSRFGIGKNPSVTPGPTMFSNLTAPVIQRVADVAATRAANRFEAQKGIGIGPSVTPVTPVATPVTPVTGKNTTPPVTAEDLNPATSPDTGAGITPPHPADKYKDIYDLAPNLSDAGFKALMKEHPEISGLGYSEGPDGRMLRIIDRPKPAAPELVTIPEAHNAAQLEIARESMKSREGYQKERIATTNRGIDEVRKAESERKVAADFEKKLKDRSPKDLYGNPNMKVGLFDMATSGAQVHPAYQEEAKNVMNEFENYYQSFIKTKGLPDTKENRKKTESMFKKYISLGPSLLSQ